MKNKNLRILIIEDDSVDRMNMERAFRKNDMKYSLHMAENGEEALCMLRGEGAKTIVKPEIIILDLNMPKMGGLEFLQKLRGDSDLKGISVFVMTTSNEESDRNEAFQLNVAGYVLKPLEINEFIGTIGALDRYWKICEYPSINYANN